MRRYDKEIADTKEIERILERGILCSIAFSDGDEPYLITVNFGYSDGSIYFHSAGTGKKMNLISKNPQVCFQVVVDDELVTGENACNDFTMKYKSVVGYGRISVLEDEEEKRRALSILMKQHTGKEEFTFDEKIIAETVVLKISIDRMTGKKSGY